MYIYFISGDYWLIISQHYWWYQHITTLHNNDHNCIIINYRDVDIYKQKDSKTVPFWLHHTVGNIGFLLPCFMSQNCISLAGGAVWPMQPKAKQSGIYQLYKTYTSRSCNAEYSGKSIFIGNPGEICFLSHWFLAFLALVGFIKYLLL